MAQGRDDYILAVIWTTDSIQEFLIDVFINTLISDIGDVGP